MNAESTIKPTALSDAIGKQEYNIHDVQALLSGALALLDGGGTAWRLLTMANERLDAIGEVLGQVELNLAGVQQ